MKLRSPSPRITLEQSATLIDAQGRTTDVVVVDVSREGFRVRSDEVIAGKPVALRVVKLGDFRITLKWVRGNEAGGVFLEGPPDVA